MRVRSGAAILVGTILLSSGCGQQNATQAPEASAVPATAEVLSQDVRTLERLRELVGFVPFDTPQELLAVQAVGLVGVVDGVFEGRSLISESDAYPTRDNTVVVRVRVTRTLKDPKSLIQEQTAYVSLPRGINALNPDGTIMPDDPNPSLKKVQDALPSGLRVLVISQPENRDLPLKNPAVTVGAEPHPLPDGAVLLQGMHPQTFVVDRGDDVVEGWAAWTYDELLEELDS
jgi:hypothetical protein